MATHTTTSIFSKLWIQAFVAQFVQEDWSDMPLTCYTQYPGSVTEGFSSESKDGQSVQKYEFSYVRYIGPIETSDDFTATFTPKTNEGVMRVHISFYDHKFDAVDAIELDEETIAQIIGDYLNAYAQEDVVLKSWETRSGTDLLMMIDGNILLLRTIDIAYSGKGVHYDGSFRLAIDIPDP